eukprot:jgi/Bigna1/60869/fgenesh1_kg.16_\
MWMLLWTGQTLLPCPFHAQQAALDSPASLLACWPAGLPTLLSTNFEPEGMPSRTLTLWESSLSSNANPTKRFSEPS